jgi:YHS domain-containing protein
MKTAGSNSMVKTSKDLICGMDVPEQAAKEAGRTVHHEGHTYYFCTPGCRLEFLADVSAYVVKDRAGADRHGAAGATQAIKDPVCGMSVDELKSEDAGWFVKLHGKPYHFCSRTCLKSFLTEPEKFLAADTEHNQLAMKEMHPAGAPVESHSTHAAIIPEGSARDMTHDQIRWDKATDGAIRNRSNSVGVVDWDGPDKDQESGSTKDWGSWGKFPGAEYLGLKEKKAKQESPHLQADGEKPTSQSHVTETESHHQSDDSRDGQVRQ